MVDMIYRVLLYSILGMFCAIGAFSFLTGCCSVQADTLYVDDSGGAPYATIQDAIDAANTSDTIYILAGTYLETIDINKPLTVQGISRESVSIEGSGNHTVIVSSNNVTLTDISIRNSGISSHFSGIFLKDISNCTVQRIWVRYAGNGVYLVSTTDNIISDNSIELCNCGLYLSNADDNMITKNDVHNNNMYGVQVSVSSTNNIFSENDFSLNLVKNAYDLASNIWSYQEKGNYWDDYTGYDNNSNGIGDTPYLIDSNSLDAHPLGDFLSIDQQPIAYIDAISPTTTVYGSEVSFTGHGSDDGLLIEYQWVSSLDGSIGSSASFSSSTLSIGSHTISFRVKDDQDQWSAYTTQSLTINSESEPENQPPTATIGSIDPAQAHERDAVYFHGYGVDTDGYIASYQWSSSKDGVLSLDSSFTSTTLSLGTHTIQFKVRDNLGLWSNTASATVTILENTTPPDPNQAPIIVTDGPYKGGINEVLAFDGSQTYDPDKDVLTSFIWDFGDGNTSMGSIVTHSYTATGNYTVTITVMDEHDLESSEVTYVSITMEDNNSQNQEPSDAVGSTPGFTVLLLVFVIGFFVFYYQHRRKQ